MFVSFYKPAPEFLCHLQPGLPPLSSREEAEEEEGGWDPDPGVLPLRGPPSIHPGSAPLRGVSVSDPRWPDSQTEVTAISPPVGQDGCGNWQEERGVGAGGAAPGSRRRTGLHLGRGGSCVTPSW